MILFSADWHIKLGQKNVPVEWARNRYYEFFDQLHTLERDQDLHIIGGDVFDRIPTMEELELFIEYLRNVKIPTIIFDGNHEATKKNHTFFTNLKIIAESVNPNVEVVTEPVITDYNILPYCYLHRKGEIEKLNSRLPLFTHVRGEVPPHVKPEVDLERLKPFPVVFAGDLHSHDNCQGNIVYPGSPMTTSFHRSKVETGVIIIREDWDWWWERLHLPQLLRKTVNSSEEMIQGDYDHIIYEIEGDLSELANIKNSDLLDKKVIKRSTDTSLILDKDMRIEDELAEYLEFILEISSERVSDILNTFQTYAKDAI